METTSKIPSNLTFDPDLRAHPSPASAKVLNDLLIASDHGYISILVLLDLSVAFETKVHHILLQRSCWYQRLCPTLA